MVLQRRLDYGFNGYQVPSVPRASRSARGRGSLRKKDENNQIHAFEILATLAGKLLQERESSGPTNAASGKDQHIIVKNTVRREQQDDGQPLKLEHCDQGSCECDENNFVYVPGLQGHHQSYTFNEFSHAHNDFSFKISSTLINSDQSEKICFTEKLAIVNSKNVCGSSTSKVLGDFPGYGVTFESKVEGVVEGKLKVEPKIRSTINRTMPDNGSPMELDGKPPALVSSDTSVKASLFRDRMTPGPFHRRQDNTKVVSEDDDEISFGCAQPGTIMKPYRPSPHIRDRRIRKLSASKYRRVASNFKNRGFSNTDGKTKPFYRNWKTCYMRQRFQKISPLKRKKLPDRSLASSDRRFRCEGIYNSSEKRINASGASSSIAGQQASPQSRDCNVKLSIKSFRVPELFIEIPATATVGSLKRTVMEAMTAILGDGLHIGVLLQGKKVRDDSKTLLQTGISQDDKLRTVGFMLEPSYAQIPSPLCTEDPSFLLPGGSPQQLTRYSATPNLESGTSNVSPKPPVTNLGNCVEGDLDKVASLTDISTYKTMCESRALVAVPAMSMEALAVVPFHQKSSRPEFVQRRIRRPFSVSEVEALVQAVEKLGTGRWRDVKLCSFVSAKHRTYVDLKDKWKTLVHTARISPQQRRGEPVPQELLDRVLAAHAYWSQQQTKQQVVEAV